MFALYVNDAGTLSTNRFDVIRLLMGECQMRFADVKLVLAGVRTKVMTGKVSVLQALQNRLEDLGASAVIESCTEGNDETSV